MTKNSYDAIGVTATPATLTAAYTGNTKTLLAKYLQNLHLDIKYTPKAAQTNRYAYILVEVSNDDGTTFLPLTVLSSGTQEAKAYNVDADTNIGIPIIVPGGKVSTGGVAYSANVDLNIEADQIKISAKESGSGNNGTLYCRVSLSEKQ